MSKKTNSGLWEYLERTGILENGTDDEIKAARKTYRKEYLLKYKQKQRKHKPEFTVNFSNEKGEFYKVKNAAKNHKMTITSFIRKATIAYLNQKYIVPNLDQIVRLEQILSQCLNEIQSIVKVKDRFFWESDKRLEIIENRIAKLETEINDVFRNPPLVKQSTQNQLQQHTEYDNQNQII
ncbi:MAG: hypothetical protein ABIJ97_02535 [Bacteroidota bacterium]